MAPQSQSSTTPTTTPTKNSNSSSSPTKDTPTNKNKSKTKLSVLQQLQSPDGYYRYLAITKVPSSSASTNSFLQPKSTTDDKSTADEKDGQPNKDKIKRNFRKLSLRHHPDRPGGDAETFRSLKRAKLVLMDDKLRKEYDLLGLDLEEDQESEDHQEDESGGDEGRREGDTVISHMASATIAAILQIAVKTVMMAIISTLLSRFRYLLYPTVLFLLFTSTRIFRAHRNKPPLATRFDIANPILIALGMYVMHSARRHAYLQKEEEFATWKFYFAEVMVMTLFILNSLTTDKSAPVRPSPMVCGGYTAMSVIVCFWIRGRVWRYAILVVMELGCALSAVLVFPLMEMVLEEIMKDKLKKIGEKVRAYATVLEEEVGSCERCRMRGEDDDDCGDGVDVLKKRRARSGSSSGGID